MTTISLVVFDIAGTTIEDRGEVLAAFVAALKDHDIPAEKDTLKRWRGADKREVLRHFIEQRFGQHDPHNEARAARIYAAFRDRLESRYLNEGVQPIAGAEETFAWLHERGIKIALTTGFYRRVTDIILQGAGWDASRIDVSVCSDEVPRGRPAPYMIYRAMEATGVIDVRRAVKVGDTVLDLTAGMNAGLRGVVGVLSGSQRIDELGSVAHTHIITSVASLPQLLESAF